MEGREGEMELQDGEGEKRIQEEGLRQHSVKYVHSSMADHCNWSW